MNTDEIYQLLDDIYNILLGMKMDPAIPRHAKEATGVHIQTIEEALEKLEPFLRG